MYLRSLIRRTSSAALLALLAVGSGHSPIPATAQSNEPQPTTQTDAASKLDERWARLVTRGDAIGLDRTRGTDSGQAVLSLHVNLSDNSVAGRASSPAPVSIRVTRGGELIQQSVLNPIDRGDGYTFTGWMTFGGRLSAGDVVEAAQSGAVVQHRVSTSAARLDATTNQVVGSAPPGQAVTAYVFSLEAADAVYTATTVAAADGAFTATLSGGYDVKPGDSGYVIVRGPVTSQSRSIYALRLLIMNSRGAVAGIGDVSEQQISVNATLRSGRNVALSVNYFQQGVFSAVVPGISGGEALQRVTASIAGQTVSVDAFNLSADCTADGAQVVGATTPSTRVTFGRYAGSLNEVPVNTQALLPQAVQTTTADSSGKFALPTTRSAGVVEWLTVLNADGHGMAEPIVCGRFVIQSGDGDVYNPGWIWPSIPTNIFAEVAPYSNPAVFSLVGASGLLKTEVAVTLFNGGMGAYGQLPSLEAGDRVVLRMATRTISTTIPALSARYDIERRVISGTAPAGQPVVFSILPIYLPYEPIAPPFPGPAPTSPPPSGAPTATPTAPIPGAPTPQPLARSAGSGQPFPGPGIERTVLTTTADANGVFAVDVSAIKGIDTPWIGTVSVTSAEGHVFVRQLLQASVACLSIGDADVGGSYVFIRSSCRSSVALSVRLLDSTGNLKAQGESSLGVPGYYQNGSIFWFSNAVLQPGDQIEINGDSTGRITVPALSASINGDQVSGSAPAGAQVSIQTRSDLPNSRFGSLPAPGGLVQVAASAGGQYSATMPIGPGAFALARVTAPGGHNFGARAVVPALLFNTQTNALRVRLKPFERFELASYAPDGALIGSLPGRADAFGGAELFTGPQRPGGRVVITGTTRTFTLAVPRLTAALINDRTAVRGVAPANARVHLYEFGLESFRPSANTTTAAANGDYAITLPLRQSDFGLRPMWVETQLGPEQYAFADVAPIGVQLMLDTNCLIGALPFNGAGVNATLAGLTATTPATVAVKSSVSVTTSNTGELYQPVCFSAPIRGGDNILFSVPNGPSFAVAVPVLSARYDATRRAIVGRGPAGGAPRVTINVSDVDRSTTSRRSVPVGADGAFAADVSDATRYALQSVEVVWSDNAGNAFVRMLALSPYSVRLPVAYKQ
jgi:hypothetical protein